MSGGRDGGSSRSTLLGRFIESFRRPPSQPRQEQRPVEEDLGLKTLRTVYAQYTQTEEPVEKERRLYTMLPLFLKNCSRLKGSELVTRFPECLEFSEHVALLFVRHVTQISQLYGSRGSEALLRFLGGERRDGEVQTGLLTLQVLQVFSEGPSQLVDAVMTNDFSSILVRCVHLFLDLPPPSPPTKPKSCESWSSPKTEAAGATCGAVGCANDRDSDDPEIQQSQRMSLQRLLTSMLTHLCRHTSAVECLMKFNDLALLFGAISSPCLPYNKIWRKSATDCLLAIFRHSLSSEVINYVHTKGCIGFCIRNIKLSVDQPPLDLVEIFATIFCCLKDSSDMSQILIEDFAANGGHKFLFDYLLYLERKGDDEAREAVRNMVFLISGLVTAGFHPVEVSVSQVGPFQVEDFSIPRPLGPGSSVRNVNIFLVLQDAFIQSLSAHLGKTLLDTILNIYRSDPVNYFVLESQRTLPTFLEIAPQKNTAVQKQMFQLLEHVMVDINYVPIPELTSLGLLLQQKEYPKTVCLGFNFLLRLISHTARYKDVFREVGILQVLVRDLETYVSDLRENEEEEDRPDTHSDLVSPSLPLQELQGDTEEYIFLLMECLRATIEGNIQNGQVFRELGGSRLTLELVTYYKPRRMALRLITQLILLPDGSVDFNSLLDQLNCSAQTAVSVKSEILRSVLRVFQLDSQKKAVFREVCGFHYLISTLASLIGSLAPRRCSPWVGVPRSDVLKLVQLVFVVLMSAMQDDPANKMFFETNIRFQSFTAPLLLLGCFSRHITVFPPSVTDEDEDISSNPGFQSFEAEFKTWQQPGEKLDENSFVFSAAEVFRFLRDMALDIPMTQSISLLQMSSRKSAFMSVASRVTGHLVHPGAVLCMIDLLPSVHMKTQSMAEEEEEEEEMQFSSCLTSREGSEAPQVTFVPNCTTVAVNGDHQETKQNHQNGRGRGSSDEVAICETPSLESSRGESEEEEELREAVTGSQRKRLERNYCKMPPCEARKWCLFLQERVVTEIFSMAMSERNQQALCQVNLPQRILQRCGPVLANEAHPLHQALERTFERLSYQSLTPSDFRSFLRLGDPLSCTINTVTLQQLEEEANRIGLISDGDDPSSNGPTNPEAHSVKQEPNTSSEISNTTLNNFETKSDVILSSGTSDKISKDSEERVNASVAPGSSNHKRKYGGSLSLARIQSLVSMTTPRASNISSVLGSPMFIEIDHSIDGFGCLFLPSIFPQQISLSQQMQGVVQSPSSLSVSTSGVGYGSERLFPPNNGLTFSCWFYISSVSANDETPFTLFSLSQNFLGLDNKVISIPCFRILANFSTESLTVTLQQSNKEQMREFITDDIKTDKIDTICFNCPQFVQLQAWHHIVVTMAKTLRQKSKVSLFMDGVPLGVQKMAYLRPACPPESGFLPFPSETAPYLVSAHIGTHVSQRHVSDLLIRLGPTYLFDEPVGAQTAGAIHKLGPSYFGSFQAPVVGDNSLSSLLSPGVFGDPLPPLVPEDRVVFGVSASHPTTKTVAELGKTYSTVDTATIARELLLAENDDATPVHLLHNTSFHLFGPARSLGAIMCGYSGLRSFQPQPLRNLLSSVGGTSVMLGLVAMATSVDALYASMKALVCIVGNNETALKEMERTGGFQVLGMLLRGKSHLINGNILHLTFTLVGTVDSEHENSCIPNPIAFRDLLADLTVWSGTSEDIQRSLLSHFFDLITHTRAHASNTQHMLEIKLVSLLLFRLHDNRLSRATIKSICNVINAILGSSPSHEDLQRVGQLLVTTLSHRDKGDENKIDINTDSPTRSPSLSSPPESSPSEGGGGEKEEAVGEEVRRRDVVLRNMMLDMVLSLLSSSHMELNSRFALLLGEALGLDWILLFLHRHTHHDTVIRALRLLVQLLSLEKLQQRFHDGELFGPWIRGFGTLPPEMTTLIETSVTQLNPLKPHPQFPLPGVAVLATLLPRHLGSPQVFLLMIALLLGKTGLNIPFSAPFDMETLDNVFQVGDSAAMNSVRLFPDAAFVLLSMARVLLHQSTADERGGKQGPVGLLVKFLERLYRTLPQFCSMATSTEFIEALTATLFPPHDLLTSPSAGGRGRIGGSEGENECSDMIEFDDNEFVVVANKESEASMDRLRQQESSAALLRTQDVAVCSVVQLLRTIAVDGFALTSPGSRDQKPVCPVLELVLSASPSVASPDLQNKYQTLILNSILDHLQVGNEDVTVIFHSAAPQIFSRAMTGVGVFCGRLVDRLWQGVYLDPSHKVYEFLLSLVEQALKQPNVLPLGDLYRALNRTILFQLSVVPTTEKDQKALMDTLCNYSGQAHTIFDETNVDSEFLECVTYRLLQIMFSDSRGSTGRFEEGGGAKENWSSGYQPMAKSVMKSGANRLWQKMLEMKHETLQTVLSVELPIPSSAPISVVSVINTAVTSSYPDIPPPTPPPTSQTPPTLPSSNPVFLRLQGCQSLMTQSLTKAWDSYLISERHAPSLDNISRSTRGSEKRTGGILRASVGRRKDRETLSHSMLEGIVREYVDVLCPVLVLAAVKYEDMVVLKHKRNMDYRLRFTVLEWSRIEWELTRERGLWGPDQPSPLDKWMLDTVEGPHRMRKRMCRNHLFYHDYPYDPNASASFKKTKHQKSTSTHCKLHFVLKSMFQRPNVLSGSSLGSHGNKPLPFASPGSDSLLSMSIEYPSGVGTNSASGEDAVSSPPPLSKIDMFPKSSEDDPVSQAIAKMIEPDDEVVAKFQSARLTGLDSKDGVLLLGTTHFYVIEGVTLLAGGGALIDIESAPDGSYDPVLPAHLHLPSTTSENVSIGCVKWPYAVVREIHKRRYLLQHCALEVFSSDGRNQFLIFHAIQRDKLYQKLKSRCPNLAESGNDTVAGTNPDRDPEQTPGLLSALITGDKSLATRWANGEMSNFQYLMQLNTLAGRTYNDLMQYPIFPWVLADYENDSLDLTNPATFRDFSLPMGAQNRQRLKRFIDRYNLTKEDPTGEGTPAYYYGTHYSSAMIVASYLIRMEPFTGHFIKLQGGHFDLPDRLFHSIHLAWVSASSTNMADIKELIPEFFYLPEFISNSNHFDLGTKQSGEPLGDVVLPPWAKGCPIEFIRLHREALESDYVSAHLHEWIDLIFGYKQTGKEALKAHNVFHHLFYEGAVDIEKIDDPVEKNAAISFIHNFGQMPKQIFKRPHPARKVFSSSASPSLAAPPVAMDTTRVFYKNLTQLMPSREPVKEIRGEVHHISLVGDRNLLALDRNKLPLPPLYSRYFMWGFPDRSARVASVEADKVVSVFENLHQGRILCSAMPQDNMLLTGGDSTIVCVWEMKNVGSRERSPVQLQLKHTLHGHTDSVTCIAASTAYNIIVSGSKDQTCIIWDMNKMVFVRQLREHTGPVTMAVINRSNGNIVSCTKSQICLWTVNGLLLASTTVLITGNFSLLCCALSEMFDWDQENVVVAGSTDGIVRMWVVEYVKEGESPQSPGKKKVANERLEAKTATGQQEDISSANGMSSDSEDEVYTTPQGSTNNQSAGKRKQSDEGKDNPLYHADSDQETTPPIKAEATTAHNGLDDRGLPLTREDVTRAKPDTLTVNVPDRTRSRSLRETSERGAETKGVRSRSQPPEIEIPTSMEDGVCGESVTESPRLPQHPCNIPIKTQIRTSESDSNTLGTETRPAGEAWQPPSSPGLAHYLEETKRRARELREKTGQWSRRLTLVHTLTMHTAMARKDNDTPAAVTSLCISRDHRRLYVGDSRGRVFSWTVSDTQGGVMEHWLRDEAVDKCMKCSAEFTFTERKHHCRDCGKIFCHRCSAYESEVKRLRIFKKVRVCEECYKNLRPKQSPKL